ncbi:MAG TPA: Xaa-Pro peptidase family protein [Candidatus Baltobacteraceae bacterium]|nr:Xaa-Pro peptidase family protein [Candidatus Baltobacteraceae bacterium]HTZ72365.1 Xaa-Pro peptidase family protein [Candidatus Aquilonibacter sp.]
MKEGDAESPSFDFGERLARLRKGLRADALLVTLPANILYLCGFSGSAGILLVEPARSTLFTDSRYTFQSRQEVKNARIVIAKAGLLKAAGDLLAGRKGRITLAASLKHLTVAQQQALGGRFAKRLRWKDDGGAIEQLRAVKSDAELKIMRDAAILISRVFEKLVPRIRPGVAELELAARIDYEIKLMGGSGPSFETIVAAGPRSSWAHARPSTKPLAKNELVVIDHGAILRAYCSDLTRTVYVGRASTKVRQLYAAVLEAQQAAKAAIRPGVTAGAVDAAARSTLKRRRLAQYFTHSTGHGLGLEIHEMPRIGRGEETLLQEGMVVTVEPGVYLDGVGGIRIEDDVVVTKTGAVDITTAPRDFLEL